MTTNNNFNGPVQRTNNYYYLGPLPLAEVRARARAESPPVRVRAEFAELERLVHSLADRVETLEWMLMDGVDSDSEVIEDYPEPEVTELSEEQRKTLQAKEKAIQKERLTTDRKDKKTHMKLNIRKKNAFAEAVDNLQSPFAVLEAEDSEIPSDDDCVQFDTTGMENAVVRDASSPPPLDLEDEAKLCMSAGCTRKPSKPGFDFCFPCWKKTNPKLEDCQL